MVKNLSGGKRAKAAGRKFVTAPLAKLRVADQPGEMYALVTKFWGNGLLGVKCADGKERKCVIRGKFRGGGKRDNHAAVGGGLLVGLRSFASDQETCDLLEVYSAADLERLRLQDAAWTPLLGEVDPVDDSDIVAADVAVDAAIDFDGI